MLKNLLLRLYLSPTPGFTAADKAVRTLLPHCLHQPQTLADRLVRHPETAPFFEALGRTDPFEPCPRIAEQLARHGIKCLTLLEPDYPEPLKEIPDPAPLLFYQGLLPNPDTLAIGIVGARKATPVGSQAARDISQELSAAGVAVISGLAEGIDTAAHEGALAGGGYTLAVLGCGLGHTYPASNLRLRRRILDNGGGILSEFPPELPARNWNFPRRNRIISGLSAAVLLVEAGLKSGSLITARYALDQGRDLFAVPGSVRNPVSQGTNQMLKEGAVPVTEGADILAYYSLRTPTCTPMRAPAPALSSEECQVVSLLEREGPLALDALASVSDMSVPQLLSTLASLEIDGTVTRWITGEYVVKK